MSNLCADCQWFDNTVRRPVTESERVRVTDTDTGMCRYNAPVLLASPQPSTNPWPFCKATDWCSRFTARE